MLWFSECLLSFHSWQLCFICTIDKQECTPLFTLSCLGKASEMIFQKNPNHYLALSCLRLLFIWLMQAPMQYRKASNYCLALQNKVLKQLKLQAFGQLFINLILSLSDLYMNNFVFLLGLWEQRLKTHKYSSNKICAKCLLMITISLCFEVICCVIVV